MASLRTSILAATLAVVPFAFGGHVALASTVTGGLTYSASAELFGNIDGTGGWFLAGTGSFSVNGGLSSYVDAADDWQLDADIGLVNGPSLSESETWGSATSAFGLVAANTPFSSSLLFTLFSNIIVTTEQALPPTNVMGGDYTFGGGWGAFPAGDTLTWSFFNLDPSGTTGSGPGEISLTGDFVFTLAGSDAEATIASLTTFLTGAPIPPGALLELIPISGFALDLAMTLTPLTSPPPPGVIPLPAALPLLAGGLGVLGMMGWRRRRAG